MDNDVREIATIHTTIPKPEDYFKKSGFNAEWIKSGATKETVEFASKVGNYMAKKRT
jgi:hypothetical protein